MTDFSAKISFFVVVVFPSGCVFYNYVFGGVSREERFIKPLPAKAQKKDQYCHKYCA